MNYSSLEDAENIFQPLWEDGERVFSRGWGDAGDGRRITVLIVELAADSLTSDALDRLAHEYALKDELDSAWAVRPLQMGPEHGRPMLVLEDPGGEPLARLLGQPMEIGVFLRLAIGVATALRKAHKVGLVHKDIKPGNILVKCADGAVRLTGFGIATRLPRERRTLAPPETIAGTLAYMAPEQTGWMNRSIDSRSDLYSLGVVFYQMLVGALPFTASDPTEWVHCHVARKPTPPGDRVETVPAPISKIVMKLLAKAADERYQSAAGLERDLRRCLADWERHRRIDDFPLGLNDTPDRLLIPETLYGRTREVAILLAGFERIVQGGAPELVLVSGYSGIGKSAVVNELHKVLVPPRGLFASGKFDQYKRDIPYSTLAQAFQGLVRALLAKSDAELDAWRGAFMEALEPNARLMTDLIPELKLIIGEQPPVPELEPRQGQSRFQLVFRRFIGVFARPEHPLALFIDDLQWLDGATLDLLEGLLTRPELRHLLLIGAYRDNEVEATHPLMRKLDAIRQAGAQVQEICLKPLARDDLGQLIADALRCESERSSPLAQLVHDKTAGSPFFAIQFLHTLAAEGLLAFDHDEARWRWDLARIHAKSYTDNVVDLMAAKLSRLPVETQRALQQMACLGNRAEMTMLAIVLQTTEEQIDTALWPAVRGELVERVAGSYKFVHDRVQEAAYSLIPESLRAEVHLRIGRLLAAQAPPEKREGTIFEIVNQMNRGAALITSRDEREQLAELNLIAGKRAKASTAYASALTYLDFSGTLLAEDSWERRRELIFAVELNRAECEFLTSQLSVAEQRLAALSNRATTTVEQAIVACLRMDVYTTLDQSSRVIAVCLDYLRHVGIEWSPDPTEEDVRREYRRIWSLLGSRAIEELIDLPLMDDPATLATVEALSKARTWSPSLSADANLPALMICKAASLSLERGNCDASCVAYVQLSAIAGPRFGDYQAGFRFGRLGYELVERRGLKRFEARAYLNFAIFVALWTKHVRASRNLMRRAFEAANRIGDLMRVAYTHNTLNADLLFAGEPLSEVQGEAERGLAFVEKAGFGLIIDVITTQLALIRMLRGLTRKFGCFDNGQFHELDMESRLSGNSVQPNAACLYWIRKLQARYIAGDYATAMDAGSKAQRLLWTAYAHFEEAEHHFYAALARAAYCDSAPADERQQHIDAIAAHHRRLQVWAANCPENFENRAALVGAEIARIEGRDAEAMRLFEQAIESARANGFIHNEALAYERASHFYRARGFIQIADLYLRNARYGYLRWGADGKVRQLEERYPSLREESAPTSGAATIGAPVAQLDVEAVVKASQAVSGEIVLENLIRTLMVIAVEHAGAERGLLILPRGDQLWVEAEATTGLNTVEVSLGQALVAPSELPMSILQYAIRTQEPLVSDDASRENPFSADEYVASRPVRSVLCLPLIKQAKLEGLLYLENNVVASVFTPARIAVLKMLASQAAISLENARLYGELTVSEERWRNLFESVPVGVNMVGSHRRYVAANPAFQRMTGYSEAELRSLTPVDIAHEHDRPSTEAIMAAQMAGQPYAQHRQKRYLRKDGGVVWAEVDVFPAPVAGSAPLLGGVVVDITERKRAEEALRDARADLERMARLTTMGELTASIAHEINQPLAAIVTQSEAALRFLNRDEPDLVEVQDALSSIRLDGMRAAEVILSLRALARKSEPQLTKLDIDDVIRSVLAIARGELLRHEVVLHAELAEDDRPVVGDRVQLQQVLLNLIMNGVEAMRGVTERTRELRVSSTLAEPGSVLVAVEDTGTGLDPAVAERMFQPFFTTKPDGLGMGLAICRSIIEAHGGRLWVLPRAPHGADVRFTVPVWTES